MTSSHLTEEGEGEEGSGPLMLSPPPVSSQPREAGAPGGPRVHLCSWRGVDSGWGGGGGGALAAQPSCSGRCSAPAATIFFFMKQNLLILKKKKRNTSEEMQISVIIRKPIGCLHLYVF